MEIEMQIEADMMMESMMQGDLENLQAVQRESRRLKSI